MTKDEIEDVAYKYLHEYLDDKCIKKIDKYGPSKTDIHKLKELYPENFSKVGVALWDICRDIVAEEDGLRWAEGGEYKGDHPRSL